MTHGNKKLVISGITAAILTSPIVAKAVTVGVTLPSDPNKTNYTYREYISAIYKFSLTLGTSLAVLMIIYSGYIYMTSRGDTSKLNTAKEYVSGALLGLLILYMINIILNFIGLPYS